MPLLNNKPVVVSS